MTTLQTFYYVYTAVSHSPFCNKIIYIFYIATFHWPFAFHCHYLFQISFHFHAKIDPSKKKKKRLSSGSRSATPNRLYWYCKWNTTSNSVLFQLTLLGREKQYLFLIICPVIKTLPFIELLQGSKHERVAQAQQRKELITSKCILVKCITVHSIFHSLLLLSCSFTSFIKASLNKLKALWIRLAV